MTESQNDPTITDGGSGGISVTTGTRPRSGLNGTRWDGGRRDGLPAATQAAGDGLDHRLVAGDAPRRALRWGWRRVWSRTPTVGRVFINGQLLGQCLVRGGRGDQRSGGTGGRLRASVFESGVVAVR